MPHSEIRLIPLSHPELGDIVLGKESFLIGRETQPFLELANSIFKKLSRKHAQITVSADSISLSDLGSANGTTVNGKSISTQPTVLADGDKICFAGDILFRVKYGQCIDQDKTLFTTSSDIPRDKTMFISSSDSYLDLLCEDEDDSVDMKKKKPTGGQRKQTLSFIAIGLIILALVAGYFFLYSTENKETGGLTLQGQISIDQMC
ncbi:MAG: FHA domain-containing protein [Methylococcales bacterium]